LPNGAVASKSPRWSLVPFAGRAAMAQDHIADEKLQVRALRRIQRIVVLDRNI
jgi:hypothetical protein